MEGSGLSLILMWAYYAGICLLGPRKTTKRLSQA
jgi:hypothetical protein